VLPKAKDSNEKNRNRRIRRGKAAVPTGKESFAVIREVATHPQTTENKVKSNWWSKDVLMISGIGAAGMLLISVLLMIFMSRSTPVAQSTNAHLIAPNSENSTNVARSDGATIDPVVPVEPTKSDEDSGVNSNSIQSTSVDEKSQSSQGDRSEQALNRRPLSGEMTVEQVVAGAEQSVAFIKGRRGTGSGFVIGEGLIATNQHVIENELVDHITIHFPSAQSDLRGPLSAELVYVDPEKDLAFLNVETALTALPIPAEHSFRRGQEVIVIGNPGLADIVLQNAVSRGVLSTEAIIEGQRYYQLGISINPGNSGGPVLDASGKIIGILTLKATLQEGIAFCLPLNDINEGLAKVREISASEIQVVRSQHCLGVVVRTISTMTDRYSMAMKIYLESMENAINSGRSADSGLEAVRTTVTEKLNGLDSWLVDSDLTREASRISGDINLPERTREQFSDLWTNYKEMKSNVENPRGTVETFRSKLLQLSDQHERLMHALDLQLGRNGN
jgi:S1-C subfamily serine protease